MTAVRALLAGIVDYAGLFPPAALDMATAVRNYASYRAERDAWMLGRFVVPIARLAELTDAIGAAALDVDPPWRLSGLLGADPLGAIAAAHAFNRVYGEHTLIDSLEGAIELQSVAGAAAAAGELTLFVEGSAQHDPEPLVAAVQRAGARAKIRTGGIRPETIPSPESVVRFIRTCIDRGVPFKATAGLHHPLRAEYQLTYDDGGPRGVMFGYLNVFLAAAMMSAGLSDADGARLLDERDPSAFEISSRGIAWGGQSVTTEQMRRTREVVATSFGSCSFREPVDELASLEFPTT